ncbi:MAG: VOC family protein [Nitrospira sp.]
MLNYDHDPIAASYPLDHIALRVPDRDAAVSSFTRIGYRVVADFPIQLEDGSTARSYALEKEGSPGIFISSGPPGSKIWRWVNDRGGRGSVHHHAYVVYDVAEEMKRWQSEGIKFTTDMPIVCDCPTPLVQVFTVEDPTTGLVSELIERNGHPGFCPGNVAKLMSSSSE